MTNSDFLQSKAGCARPQVLCVTMDDTTPAPDLVRPSTQYSRLRESLEDGTLTRDGTEDRRELFFSPTPMRTTPPSITQYYYWT